MLKVKHSLLHSICYAMPSRITLHIITTQSTTVVKVSNLKENVEKQKSYWTTALQNLSFSLYSHVVSSVLVCKFAPQLTYFYTYELYLNGQM